MNILDDTIGYLLCLFLIFMVRKFYMMRMLLDV